MPWKDYASACCSAPVLFFSVIDLDKIESLAIAGKPESEVLSHVPEKASLSEVFNQYWGVSTWAEVREIACHRKARRIISIAERV